MFCCAQGIVANHEPGGEINDQGYRVALMMDESLESGSKKIYARSGCSIYGIKPELGEKCLIIIWATAWPAHDPEA